MELKFKTSNGNIVAYEKESEVIEDNQITNEDYLLNDFDYDVGKTHNLLVAQNGEGWCVLKNSKAITDFANSGCLVDDDDLWNSFVEDETGTHKLYTYTKEYQD